MNYQDLFDNTNWRKVKGLSPNSRSGMEGRQHRESSKKAITEGVKKNWETRSRTISQKHKDAIRDKAKPIQTPDGVFANVPAYAEFLNIGRNSVYWKIKKYPNQYFYITKAAE